MKLTQKRIEKLQPKAKRYIVWDSAAGEGLRLGVRVTPRGRKLYIVDFTTKDGRQRRMTLEGGVGAMPPTEARKVARRLTAGLNEGADPLKERQKSRLRGMKIDKLWKRYVEEYLDHPRPATRRGHRPLSPKTRREYLRQWDAHLEKAFGRKRADSVALDEVRRFHQKIGRKSPYLANRLVATLGSLFNFAEHAGVLERGTNPARGLIRFEEKSRERFLSSEELARLGEVLRLAEQEEGGEVERDGETVKVEGEMWQAVEAIRLLLFTGARKSEILTLQWSDVDIERGLLNLKDVKGGDRPVFLNAPALAVLAGLDRLEGAPWVLPGRHGRKPFAGLTAIWGRIREAAGLEGVRIHDLRHSVASTGRMAGLPLGILQGLLGHREARTTQRYAHLGVSPIQEAAETIGQRISEAMAPKKESKDKVAKHPAVGAANVD